LELSYIPRLTKFWAVEFGLKLLLWLLRELIPLRISEEVGTLLASVKLNLKLLLVRVLFGAWNTLPNFDFLIFPFVVAFEAVLDL
jgi:hypothetical protein